MNDTLPPQDIVSDIWLILSEIFKQTIEQTKDNNRGEYHIKNSNNRRESYFI